MLTYKLTADNISLPKYANYLTDEQKSRTLRHILIDPSSLSIHILKAVARDHDVVVPKQRALVVAALQAHVCAWSCLVLSVHGLDAGQLSVDPMTVNQSRFPLPRSNDVRSPARKRQRAEVAHTHHVSLEANVEEWAAAWPQLESEESLNDVCYAMQSLLSSY
jgi:hypothetical protein